MKHLDASIMWWATCWASAFLFSERRFEPAIMLWVTGLILIGVTFLGRKDG